jgi:hypothetical protein
MVRTTRLITDNVLTWPVVRPQGVDCVRNQQVRLLKQWVVKAVSKLLPTDCRPADCPVGELDRIDG